MSPKKKNPEDSINPLVHNSVDMDDIPLADREYKISETQCDFDLFKFYYWLEDNFFDKFKEIGL